MTPDPQREQWEAFVVARHAEGRCEFSGLKALDCVRSICDCFDNAAGARALERGEPHRCAPCAKAKGWS